MLTWTKRDFAYPFYFWTKFTEASLTFTKRILSKNGVIIYTLIYLMNNSFYIATEYISTA